MKVTYTDPTPDHAIAPGRTWPDSASQPSSAPLTRQPRGHDENNGHPHLITGGKCGIIYDEGMSHEAPATTPRQVDIVLLGTEWQTRALLRAQLIEEGFEVLATDTWPMMRQYLHPGEKPRLAIVDLQCLPDAERVLNDLRILMKPNRVLVLTAIDTMAPNAIERLGFRVLKRPVSIGDVVAAVGRVLQEQRV